MSYSAEDFPWRADEAEASFDRAIGITEDNGADLNRDYSFTISTYRQQEAMPTLSAPSFQEDQEETYSDSVLPRNAQLDNTVIHPARAMHEYARRQPLAQGRFQHCPASSCFATGATSLTFCRPSSPQNGSGGTSSARILPPKQVRSIY